MKKVEVIVRTTEDNFPPQEKVVLKFTEQTVSSAENDAVLSYPGLEIHLEHHRVFKNGQEVYMSRYESLQSKAIFSKIQKKDFRRR